MKVIAVCGNYRKGGVTERLLAAAVEGARASGAQTDILTLREINFDFCRNCKACWAPAGRDKPLGDCVIKDELTAWMERIAAADGLILASPVNIGALTALFKKFMERCLTLTVLKPLPFFLRQLIAMPAVPVPRGCKKLRPMICITASGAPAFAGRMMMPCARKQFEALGSMWGGRITDLIWAGGSMDESYVLPDSLLEKARMAGARIATGR